MTARPAALALAALAAGLALAPADAAARRRARGVEGEVVLAGERVPVSWIDGDTFRVRGGRFGGRSARLLGVNALETFGPVHRLGASGGGALLAVARRTAALAAARTWRCEPERQPDRYGRLLVSCPEAALALVSAGHAMVFAIDGAPDARLLAAQRSAQQARAGMWAGGAPPLVPTSLHSADEARLGPSGAYDRVVDTRTGVAAARPHATTYEACQEVCLGEDGHRACLTYVPFDRWYRRKPACLR